jgi:hypothetical protein
VVDSAISYDVERYKIQLNSYNLLNKSYFDKAMFLGGLPSEERNARLTLTIVFNTIAIHAEFDLGLSLVRINNAQLIMNSTAFGYI